MAATRPQFRVISDPRAQSAWHLRRLIKAGVVAGMLAGLAMLFTEMIYSRFIGSPAWAPLQWIGAVAFDGAAPLPRGPAMVAAGLLIHFGVTAFWGFFFALFIHRADSTRHALGWGLPWGLGVWAFMTYVILPLESALLLARVRTMPVAWLMFHVVYGAGLAVTPWLMRRFARRPTRPVLVTW